MNSDSLTGKLLIAMPGIGDPRFERSLIYLCAHTEEGAMGIVVNKPAPNISFTDLLEQLGIEAGDDPIEVKNSRSYPLVHFGGPVETARGFVLHSADYNHHESTLAIDDAVGLTTTLEIVHEIARGSGPRRALLALGYAGWSPGQLEDEISRNGWLHCPADEDLLFGGDLSAKYETALQKLGVDLAFLSSEPGHA